MDKHTATQSNIQRGKVTTVRVSCSCGRYIQTDEFRKTSFKAMRVLLAKVCEEGPALERKVLKDTKVKGEKKSELTELREEIQKEIKKQKKSKTRKDEPE